MFYSHTIVNSLLQVAIGDLGYYYILLLILCHLSRSSTKCLSCSLNVCTFAYECTYAFVYVITESIHPLVKPHTSNLLPVVSQACCTSTTIPLCPSTCRSCASSVGTSWNGSGWWRRPSQLQQGWVEEQRARCTSHCWHWSLSTTGHRG